MSKLTARQAAFVREYLIDLNATQAAIRAGYSPKTAGRTAHENLKKPEIEQALAKAMTDRAESTRLSAHRVIEGLLAEAEDHGEGSSHAARVSAWAHLGKHLGMFTDKHEHTHRKDPRTMTDEELAEALYDAGLSQ